jgi:hypothetical protein
LEKAKDRKNPGQDENWAGLCAIMAKIFSAVHSFDRQIISQAKLERYLH